MIKIISRILKLSGKYRGKLLFSFVAGFLDSAMPSISILFIFLSFNWYLTGTMTLRKIALVAILLVASVLLRFVFKLLEYVYQSGVGYEIVCDGRLALGGKLSHLSMGFFSDTDAGELSSVITGDPVFVETMAMAYVSKVTGALFSAVMVTLVLFLLDWRIGLAACIAYPAALAVNQAIQRIFTKHSKGRQEAHAATSSIMLEYLQGIYVIKAFRLAGKQRQRLEGILKRLEVISYDFEMKGMPWLALYFVLFNVFTSIILLLVAFFFFGGTMTLSIALVLVTMSFALYAPMEMLVVSSGILRLMNTCLDRMQVILDYPVMDEDGAAHTPPAFDVAFRDVHFSYGNLPVGSSAVLSGVSFHAPERTLTAIVGPSGSGKSTVLNLIARFWDVQKGQIEIGGADIRSMKCDSVMSCISAVFQKAYLFHDTIEANIRFGNANATHEQVVEAAKKAHCHEFIERMENGYATVIGEGGGTLSGGERQRVSIARALLKDTPIILLDEVTANIDPENERLIQQAINALVKEKTVFVVAHKLATIQNAHQILVLGGDGTIHEQGTHESLMAIGGMYMDLWRKSQKISHWTLAGN